MAASFQHRMPTRVVLAVLLAVTLLLSVLTPSANGQPAADDCPAAVPMSQVTAGLTGSGLTVTEGNTPEAFGAEVLGVLRNAIWPGVDMIIAELDSPAVDQYGVWAGMSGSPVYADDGRLIGAVSYTLAFGKTSVAGLTPAGAMYELLSYPAANGNRPAATEVALPAGLRQRVVDQTDATPRQAGEGLSSLPVPLAVSGLRRARFAELRDRIGRNVDVRPYAASSAGAADGSVADIFPGSNFAAALSYGAVTAAGIGTTTAVCDGTALAFGHPFSWDGRTSLSAHSADAILIQEDPGWSSFKVANPGGVVGTVDQDRLAGIRAQLGTEPRVTPVWSRIRSRNLDRETTRRTWITANEWVPDLAPFHVEFHINEALDIISAGRMQLTWTVKGTRGNGTRWSLTRRNAATGRYDVSIDATSEMYEWMYLIGQNRFTSVDFGRVRATGVGDETYQRLRFGTVKVAVGGGTYRNIQNLARLRVRPGATIRARVPLIRYRQTRPFRTQTLRLTVPRRLSGSTVRLGVFGGASIQYERNVPGATSFTNLLARMRRTESRNDLVLRLQRAGGDAGPTVLKKTERTLGDVVGGRRTVRVTVR